ncbi:thioredoxin-like protein [Rhizopogon salebrosus TDB-379]|nr:thioredoxin-like protein [Rhizopogon salebrosus TDB-379]
MFSATLRAATRAHFPLAPGRGLRSAVLRQFHRSAKCQEHYLNANAQTFEKVATNPANDKVVLVDFYADWCNPCKMISPLLEKVTSDETVKTGSGRSLDLVTVDTDAEYELAAKYQVRALPTVVAFRDGKKVDQFVGALNEAAIRHFLDKV